MHHCVTMGQSAKYLPLHHCHPETSKFEPDSHALLMLRHAENLVEENVLLGKHNFHSNNPLG